MHQDLLDYLASSNGLFISDLRREVNLPQILLTVETTDNNQFSLEEWNAAVSYIFGEKLVFSKIPLVKAYFEEHAHEASE